MTKRARTENSGTCRLFPEKPAEWENEKLFGTCESLAKDHNLAFILLRRNIKFDEFCRSYPKPWLGKSAPGRVVILWHAMPMDPEAVLSWRCGLIEEGDIAYRFLYSPPPDIEDFRQWLIDILADWAQPIAPKEKAGLKIGSLVSYDRRSCLDQLIDYDPSFLTISPSGKMAGVLEKLDDCKRIFRNVIGRGVKAKREKVHVVLEGALAFSIKEESMERSAQFKTMAGKLKTALEKNFQVDRNRLPKVLLLGPSGVGKTLVARYLAWATSPQPGEELSRPFKRVPAPEYLNRENDFEYDVFGYCAGTFTGADPEGRKGYLLERLGGVVFFDEIGDANSAIQAKLLAYLDDYQVTPRGWSGDPLFCPMLIVAATNRPIDEWANDPSREDHDRLFRSDLFRRFNCVVRIPSLNERKEGELPFILDVMLQMEAFNPKRRIKEIGEGALAAFLNFDYDKGNFRDLENLVRAVCSRAVRDGRNYVVAADVETAGNEL